MVHEFLTGLLIQTQILLHIDTPKPQKSGEIVTLSTVLPKTPIVYESTDLVRPSPAAIKETKAAVRTTKTFILSKQDILNAVNEYRKSQGIAELRIDDRLQAYAQDRAEYLQQIKKLDKHAGHKEFMSSGGFGKLGFNSIAENQSWNFKGDAAGLIESFYAKSPGHNKNQLSPEYSHIGIGIAGKYTNLVFGGSKQ